MEYALLLKFPQIILPEFYILTYFKPSILKLNVISNILLSNSVTAAHATITLTTSITTRALVPDV